MTWLKDGTHISSSGRVLISANGWSLTLSDVNSADSGEYTCRALQTTNTGPITRTSSGTLIVVGECGMQIKQRLSLALWSKIQLFGSYLCEPEL